MSITGEYWEIYKDWEDDTFYKGMDEEEAEAKEEELYQKYGQRIPLKKDAPPEAVAAWKEEGRQILEMEKQMLG